MATKTVNYELTLPEDNEPADQNVFNENFETIDEILYDKVDKEEGKGLSTNDYTTNEKTKLNDIAEIKTIGNGLSLDDNGELTATGGGSGGTTNYNDLSNKPQINGNTLSGNKTGAQLGLAEVSDIPTTLAELTDDATHRTVSDTEKATWNAKADVSDIPTVPVKGVEKNGTALTPDASGVVNIIVPTTAADVSALPATTLYGASISLSINSTTFVVTAALQDQNGDTLGTAQTIDLPLESVVVNGSYDSATKKVVLTLQSGSTVEFSVADLVDGLQSEITSTNKLDADLVDDSTSTNKFVSSTEKTAWNNKSDLELGTTSTTAYRGDRGQTAYTHATDSNRLTTAKSSGLYKIATTAEGHVASATSVEKSDITALGIPAQDTTYESKSAVSGGTAVSLVTTGEKYKWNNKANSSAIPSASSATPQMNGTASSGSSSYWSRADHVHPTDTSRQAALSSTQLSAVNSGVTSTTVSHANSAYNAVIPSANSAVSSGNLDNITSNECRVYHSPSSLPSGTSGSVICTTRIVDSNTGYQDIVFITSPYASYRRAKTGGTWRAWIQITNV